MTPESSDVLVERVRKYIKGHQRIVDGPDETFTCELAPSAREPLADLNQLASALDSMREANQRLSAQVDELEESESRLQAERDCLAIERDSMREERDENRMIGVGANAWFSMVDRAERAEARIRELEEARQEILAVVNEQAEDEALWAVRLAGTQPISEAYLQQELRTLHAVIEKGNDS